MIVGSLEVHLRMDGCFSLKDKRRVLRHLLEPLRRDLNVAAAECGDQDIWNVATLGFSAVGSNRSQVESLLRSVLERIERCPVIIVEAAVLDVGSPAV